MMAVTGLNKPDFRTISTFRRRHLVRVMLTTAAQEIGAIGARGVALEAVLRVADLSPDTPRRGDLLRRLSPPETWRIEEVEPDALGLSLRLTLARAP